MYNVRHDFAAPLEVYEIQTLQHELNLETTPGTLVRDLTVLAESLLHNQVPATPSVRPVNQALAGLNDALSRPLELRIPRPTMRSYPNLTGLFLTLRALGLLRIMPHGRKRFLEVEPQRWEAWKSLNPVEQYLTALEAWLVHGSLSSIGESDLRSWESLLEQVFWLMERLSDKGVMADWKTGGWEGYNFQSRHFLLALLELSGFLEVEHGVPETGQGWVIRDFKPRPFGRALLKMLAPHVSQARARSYLRGLRVSLGLDLGDKPRFCYERKLLRMKLWNDICAVGT